jgi:hypothetical protein
MGVAMSNELLPVLSLSMTHRWRYETDEMSGVCEIARDVMVVKCIFESLSKKFYDVLQIDAAIRRRLLEPVSVERLAEQLSEDVPGVQVTVMGRADTHGWITSTALRDGYPRV